MNVVSLFTHKKEKDTMYNFQLEGEMHSGLHLVGLLENSYAIIIKIICIYQIKKM